MAQIIFGVLATAWQTVCFRPLIQRDSSIIRETYNPMEPYKRLQASRCFAWFSLRLGKLLATHGRPFRGSREVILHSTVPDKARHYEPGCGRGLL